MTVPTPEPRPTPTPTPAPTAASAPAPAPKAKPKQRDEPGAERGDGRFPRGMALRLFVYVVAGHLLAAFLFLLFKIGGAE